MVAPEDIPYKEVRLYDQVIPCMLIKTAREWSNTVTKHVPFGERSLWALLLSLPIAYLFTSILVPYFVTLFFSGILVDIEINATGKKNDSSLGAEVWMEKPVSIGKIPSGWESRGDRLVSYIPPYGPLKLSIPSNSQGITFIKQNRSGSVKITYGPSKTTIDLYSPTEVPTKLTGYEFLTGSSLAYKVLTPSIFIAILIAAFTSILTVLRRDSVLAIIIDRPAESKNTRYEPRLDHLRFMAASMVIFYHCFTDNFALGHSTYNPLLGLVEQGHMGVGLFMVLSGYLLTKIASGKELNYFDFIKNRVIRIYPLYIFCVLIMLCGWSSEYSFTQALSMFFPFVNALQGVQLPMFAHLWTIAVEFQFYLLFPFLALFLDRSGFRFIIGMLALTIFFKYLMWFKIGSVTNVSYMTLLGRIDQFLIGMAAAYLAKKYISKKQISTSWLIAAIAVSASIISIFCGLKGLIGMDQSWLMAFWPSTEAVMWAILIVSYSHARIRIPEALDVSLARLGQLSFSMYCMHYVVIPFTNSHFAGLGGARGGVADILMQTAFLTVPAIIIFSMLTYGVIEKPFLSLKTKYATALKMEKVRHPESVT
ncbi:MULTISPECIES: acyltransferase [Pseudomonas]|uniref:Peptidoglycan/LPS O-acetylase OafA/YrhL n=1 Tax=Pseudomonas umsongensis TaxID=198618 RepID=A0ACC5MFB5_9PSED|nr:MULTISPECIES: acyltransferase [Pseudomonas]MBB2887389.1 peptidoglycan/LPS O-acetylase OafA/YrhL [Pseudomonas umsongensis]